MNAIAGEYWNTHQDAAHVRNLVRLSGSSFYWAMRILPSERRRAMYAIYAFCREVDDIADAQASASWRRQELDAWRREVDDLFRGRPTRPITRSLVPAIERFNLSRSNFDAIIDGMAMDANDPLVAPDRGTLLLYCDRVASAVGRLSVCVFGENNENGMAVAGHLGQALQLTNILRDLDADAAAGRLYLPREALAEAQVPLSTPEQVLRHPALEAVCARVVDWTDEFFRGAEQAMGRCDAGAIRPARMMMQVYRCTFERLRVRGWQSPRLPVGPGKPMKLWIALRAAIA